MLQYREVDENDLCNSYETHFLFKVKNVRTLGFAGESKVKYSDVVSGGKGMNMLVRLSGGHDAHIFAHFMVFMNKDREYPILDTPDSIPVVAYRTKPKRWIDTKVFSQFLSERRVIAELQDSRTWVFYIDSFSGNNMTPESAAASNLINTVTRYLTPNSTHIIQTCD